MRRALLLVLTIALVFLCACGGGEEERLQEMRTELDPAGEIVLTAVLTAQSEEKILEYTLSCGYTGGDTTVTILAPESVAGITAQVSGEELALSYGDAALELELLTETGVAPVAVLPSMISALLEGHLQSTSTGTHGETDCIVGEFFADDGLTVSLWFQETDLVPVYGELWENGVRVAWCEISDWVCSTAE